MYRACTVSAVVEPRHEIAAQLREIPFGKGHEDFLGDARCDAPCGFQMSAEPAQVRRFSNAGSQRSRGLLHVHTTLRMRSFHRGKRVIKCTLELRVVRVSGGVSCASAGLAA